MTGTHLYNKFVKERLVVNRKATISTPFDRSKIPTMTCQKKKGTGKEKRIVAIGKADHQLFGRLYLACQRRKEFFT